MSTVNKFCIEINLGLGIDAMMLPEHVRWALAYVAEQITHAVMLNGGTGKIKDVNGQNVGKWEYK